MKFQNQLIIDSPLNVVTGLYGDSGNEILWHPSLISRHENEFDTNRSVCIYEVNGRQLKVGVTILKNNLPSTLKVIVDMDGMQHKISHNFVAVDDTKTIWTINTEYIAQGLILKLTMLVVPAMFIRRVETYMADFSAFVLSYENH